MFEALTLGLKYKIGCQKVLGSLIIFIYMGNCVKAFGDKNEAL